MIKVNLHGKLGEDIGESWELEVSNLSEALRAIEANTKKLRKWLLTNLNEYEFEFLIDNNKLFTEKNTFDSLEELSNSEFYLDVSGKIEKIDIIPKITGNDFFSDIFNSPYFKVAAGSATVGAAVVLGVLYPPLIPLAIGIGLAGIGLIAAGVSQLLSKPPPNVPFTAQQANPIDGGGESGGPTSYLFNGPVNTVGEGGPVPVGYGELVIGGNNVFANYDYLYRVYKSDYYDSNLQQKYEGSDQYLFNSRCYLINQDSMKSLPF